MAHKHDTIGIPIIKPPYITDPEVRRAIDALASETTRWLQRIAEGVDNAVGNRGEPTYYADVNGNGKRFKSLGVPVDETDAQMKGLSLGRDALSDKAWDAKGLPIINLPTGDLPKSVQDKMAMNDLFGTNALSEEQIRAIIDAKIRSAVFGENATFTASATGFTAAITGTASYTLVGGTVLLFLPSLTGTSNSTAFTITGMPTAITPVQTSNHVVTITDTSTDVYGLLRLTSGSTTITMLSSLQANGDWGNSGTKSIYPTWVAYGLF